ncbi:MAG: 3-dehydro-scyllo-inosose hydrolase [Candidatus Humimicrobiaceae bacterium]
MSNSNELLSTNVPDLFFENTSVGRLKKSVWDASDEEIDKILSDYGIPSEPEWFKEGTYLQTTIRYKVPEIRRKNDIVFIPVGCTELHGQHTVSAMDTLFVTQILEGVRRYTKKRGIPINIAMPPLLYGCHPFHHIGLPGTVIVQENNAKAFLHDVMLGLWNDGFRKQIIINNHGQLWVLESAIQDFMKKYQLPGIFRVIDWHRSVREFFRTKDRGGEFDTTFTHADEAETSVGLLLFPDLVDMNHACNTDPEFYIPGGHIDSAVDAYGRPSRWSECEGHVGLEVKITPEGVVGHAKKAAAKKAKRPIAAILKYLTLVNDEILEALPAGKVPPVEKITLRSEKEMEPYLKEPLSEGWKSVYGLNRIGF